MGWGSDYHTPASHFTLLTMRMHLRGHISSPTPPIISISLCIISVEELVDGCQHLHAKPPHSEAVKMK